MGTFITHFKCAKPASSCVVFWTTGCGFGSWLLRPRLSLGFISLPLRVGGAFLDDAEEPVDCDCDSSVL